MNVNYYINNQPIEPPPPNGQITVTLEFDYTETSHKLAYYRNRYKQVKASKRVNKVFRSLVELIRDIDRKLKDEGRKAGQIHTGGGNYPTPVASGIIRNWIRNNFS